jgi:hypothetical protein
MERLGLARGILENRKSSTIAANLILFGQTARDSQCRSVALVDRITKHQRVLLLGHPNGGPFHVDRV